MRVIVKVNTNFLNSHPISQSKGIRLRVEKLDLINCFANLQTINSAH